MRTTTYLANTLAKLIPAVTQTIDESVPNLYRTEHQWEAEQLRDSACNFAFAIRDAIDVLRAEGGDA